MLEPRSAPWIEKYLISRYVRVKRLVTIGFFNFWVCAWAFVVKKIPRENSFLAMCNVGYRIISEFINEFISKTV